MSHFGVLVLTDKKIKSRKDAEIEANSLLEPYYENLETEDHEVECYCIDGKAMCDANEKAEKELGIVWDDVRKTYWALPETTRPEWDKYEPVVKYNELKEKYHSKHPLKNKPDKDCEECHGTGKHMTTRNEEAKWDWHVVGGRWTGVYSGYDTDKDPDNFETCTVCGGTGRRDDELGKDARRKNPEYTCNGCNGTGKSRKWENKLHNGDIAPVEAVLAVYEKVGSLYAIVDPSGKWHEKGTMGWFGCSTGDMDEKQWNDEFLKILEANKHCTSIVVDCHI